MTEFDDDILRCLFNKRYMDFRTCSSLRSVSSRFSFFAAKYCRSLKELDLSDLTKAFNNHTNRLENLYPCLMETVAKYCPNLRKIVGVCIIPDSLNWASRKCLECLPKLTSVTFKEHFRDMSILLWFLKRLPRLQYVKVYTMDDKYDCFVDVSEEKKIAVSELSLGYGDFWRVFRVGCLKKVYDFHALFRYDDTIYEEFKAAIARCQNLEQLELEMHDKSSFGSDWMSVASTFRKVEILLLELEHLDVNIKLHTCPKMANKSMREFPRFWQHVKNLKFYRAGPTGYCCFIWHVN